MRHELRVEDEEWGGDDTPEEQEAFLYVLKERMEQTLLDDAKEPRKVTVGDYLKLAAIAESEAKRRGTGPKEVVVRWEDPAFITTSEEGSN